MLAAVHQSTLRRGILVNNKSTHDKIQLPPRNPTRVLLVRSEAAMRAYPAVRADLLLAERSNLGKAELLALLTGVTGSLVFPLCTLGSDLPASSGCVEDGLICMLAGALASALKATSSPITSSGREGEASSRVPELCGRLIDRISSRVDCPQVPFLAAFLIPRLGAGALPHCAMATMELCIQLCDQLQLNDEYGDMGFFVLASCHVASVLQPSAKAFLKEPTAANATPLLGYVVRTSALLPSGWEGSLAQRTAGQRLLLLLFTSPLLDMLASTPLLVHNVEEGDWLWQAAEEFPLRESSRDATMTGHILQVWPVGIQNPSPRLIHWISPLNPNPRDCSLSSAAHTLPDWADIFLR